MTGRDVSPTGALLRRSRCRLPACLVMPTARHITVASAWDQILGASSSVASSESKPTHRITAVDDLSRISVGAGIPSRAKRLGAVWLLEV
jgi:hypothetical protein